MARPRRLAINSVKRNASNRGPTSSAAWNDSFAEIVADFASVANEWNTKVVPLLSIVPDGTDQTDIDAFKFGLDGKTFYIDTDADGTVATARYYNSSKQRPNTLKEQIEKIYQTVDSSVTALETEIANNVSGLTAEEKARIGINVFDTTKTSASTSIDGRARKAQQDTIQLGKDLYGPSGTLDGDGLANLNNSLRSMLGALLALHNGTWDTDITLSHDGVVIGIDQNDVDASQTIDDNDGFAGGSVDLEQDLNRIRTRLRAILGTATWTTNATASFLEGPTNLQEVINIGGSAAKSAANPWGYNYTDVAGLNDRLNTIVSFAGMDSQTDGTPDYDSTVYINNGDSLETALEKLDAALDDVANDFDGLLAAHRQGHIGEEPRDSGQHWDADITLSNYFSFNLRDWIDHVENPDGVLLSGLQFRRQETLLEDGDQVVFVTHNRGAYPIVQTIFFDSGMNYAVEHSSINQFVFSGLDIVHGSGMIIALW